MKELTVRSIVEGEIEGEIIVSPIEISFLGGIDPETGIIIDSENPIKGQSIVNKIFVFPKSKGSTVGSYIIYGLKVNDVAPLALVANEAETIVIAGAILADIPLVDQPNEDIIQLVKTGDVLKIDTKRNKLIIK
ncbi:MAG: aconitase X swivel domain-containing protein [Candidatus Heimdallarchaeaceae archaeon]|jgi:predicted aconitase with swiveling domain